MFTIISKIEEVTTVSVSPYKRALGESGLHAFFQLGQYSGLLSLPPNRHESNLPYIIVVCVCVHTVAMGPAFLLGLVGASITMCWVAVCCACKAVVHRYSRGAIFNEEDEEEDMLQTAHCITPYPQFILVQQEGLMGKVEAMRFADARPDSTHLATEEGLYDEVGGRETQGRCDVVEGTRLPGE